MAQLIQDPIDLHVGARIRLRRSQADLTQHDLAQAIGVTFQQLQKYETGADRISASKLYGLAHVLGAPIRWFFEGAALRCAGNETDRLVLAQRINAFLAKPEAFELAAAFTTLPLDKQKIVLSLARSFANP